MQTPDKDFLGAPHDQKPPVDIAEWMLQRLNRIDNAINGVEGGPGGLKERMAALEKKSDSFATKDDVSKVKIWILGGVVGGMISITGVVFAILSYFK